MAYAQDAALISEVRTSARLLGVAAIWPSGRPLTVANSFLLEMYLLLVLIRDLCSNYRAEYLPGTGNLQHQFPRAPAPKAGRPRFNLKNAVTGAVEFQVCAGTTAADRHGHDRGIDVSIQRATASDTPGVGDVLQMFDAKFRVQPNNRISHSEFSEFARWIELFDLRGAALPGLVLPTLHQLGGHCLVTNGRHSTECDNECTRVCLREIARFHPTTVFTSRP